MKKIYFFIISLLFVNIVVSQIPKDSLYLGQTPPGNEPKIFELAVTPGHFAAERIAISKDGTEIYYSEIASYYPVAGDKVKYYKYIKNKWTGPFDLFDGYSSPALSNSGDTMFFEHDAKMFYSTKQKSEWSKPKVCFTSVDTAHYLQVTNNGNYYTSARTKTSVGGSDWCKININGKDTSAISLGFPLNSVIDNFDFYIAKDESYMITCINGPVCISYSDKKGNWTNSRYLNDKINFGIGGWGSYVTADNKYMFFTTGTKYDYSDTHIYWVSMGNIIDSMKTTNLPPYIKNKPKPQIAQVGKKFKYTFPKDAVCDDDGKTVTYEALLLDDSPLPSWLNFNTKTKTFTGTPTEAGDIALKITAKDNKNEITLFKFIISIK